MINAGNERERERQMKEPRRYRNKIKMMEMGEMNESNTRKQNTDKSGG
jgi:hypothetical protein